MRRKPKRDGFDDRIVARIGQTFLRMGILNPKGKTNSELYEEIRAGVDKYTRDQSLVIVIEHRDTILQHARSHRVANENDLAVLFYAIWVEHQLNYIVMGLAEKRRLQQQEIESMLRDTSYRAKCSWLLSTLDAKPLSILHTTLICRLMELRNGFVHFKWKARRKQLDSELISVLMGVEKTVTYLRNVENKYLYANQKRKLHRAVIKGREETHASGRTEQVVGPERRKRVSHQN